MTLACTTWGPEWKGKRLRFHIDAKAISDGLNKLSTRSLDLREEYRIIAMTAAKYEFTAEVFWIAGDHNVIAASSVEHGCVFC